MKNFEVKEMLVVLHQSGMARAFEEQQANRVYDDLTREEFVAKMCMAQMAENEERTLTRLRKTAKLRFDAQPEEIIWDSERGLDKPSLRSLLAADWIRRTENVLVSGPSGTGKTWLACALGNAVLRAGVSVRYFRTNPLLQEMRRAHVDGSIARMRKALATPKLVILDDFGIAPIDEHSKEDLFEILEARTDIGSTLIVGQLAPAEWYAYLDTRHLADAIMDRVVQRAHIIELRGHSLRRRL